MKVLGITGAVGAGKSTVLRYLEDRYRARVIQLDEVAHLLMEPGQECYHKVVAAFGAGILGDNRKIDRKKLFALTFGQEEKLGQLNGIVHPMVKEYVCEEIRRERREGKVPFVVLEAALLLEDHYEQICDSIWYIYVDYTVRVRRLVSSRGYTEEKIRQILDNQKSDEDFRGLCQFMVDNSSDILENTYEQIDRGLTEYGFL